jgi:hypothetical protein
MLKNSKWWQRSLDITDIPSVFVFLQNGGEIQDQFLSMLTIVYRANFLVRWLYFDAESFKNTFEFFGAP